MRIFSEKTGKEYKTVPECLAAEKEFDEAAAKKAAKEEQLAKERKDRAAEVENAYKAALEAQKNYRNKLNDFLKDYKSFHLTVKDVPDAPMNFFEDFISRWF